MDILIPVEGVSATLAVSQLKGVTCKHCARQFAYAMGRTVVCSAGSPLGVESERLEGLVRARAEEAVKREVTFGSDIVPCPHCGKLQPEMVRLERKKFMGRFPLLQMLAWSFVGIGFVGGFATQQGGYIVWVAFGLFFVALDLVRRCGRGRSQSLASSAVRHGPGEGVWTREDLEKLAEANPRINIADALLDWEVQKSAT